jgi:Uncharacterized conserved protein (DUF2039)
MPQNTVPSHPQQRKKKKGHAPAHQNAFAFQHNPKSKKTLTILALPNLHVCRRCHDKIEWRKKYRKYKPRTQPSKCNVCQQRNVLAAYHTICDKCSVGDKAKTIVRDFIKNLKEEQAAALVTATKSIKSDTEQKLEEVESAMKVSSLQDDHACADATNTQQPDASSSEGADSTWEGRACCMCVKEFALPDGGDENGADRDDPLSSGQKLTLRQRKTLERQRQARGKKLKEEETGDNTQQPQADDNRADSDDESDMYSDDDEDDPFLKAVGGSHKLMTGEAYQRALMEKEQQRQQVS